MERTPVGIRPGFMLRREACQLAVFSGKLPSMEAEIDDKLPSNSSSAKAPSLFCLSVISVAAYVRRFPCGYTRSRTMANFGAFAMQNCYAFASRWRFTREPVREGFEPSVAF